MDRDYKTGKSKDVGVFSGIEIEHTPAYGLQTLFLARNDLTLEQIKELASMVNAKAIYYGANRSFIYNHALQLAQMMNLMKDGYYVTIDYPYSQHTQKSKKDLNWHGRTRSSYRSVR